MSKPRKLPKGSEKTIVFNFFNFFNFLNFLNFFNFLNSFLSIKSLPEEKFFILHSSFFIFFYTFAHVFRFLF